MLVINLLHFGAVRLKRFLEWSAYEILCLIRLLRNQNKIGKTYGHLLHVIVGALMLNLISTFAWSHFVTRKMMPYIQMHYNDVLGAMIGVWNPESATCNSEIAFLLLPAQQILVIGHRLSFFMRESRGGQGVRTPPPPLENHKAIRS